jgi:hypothetical protein
MAMYKKCGKALMNETSGVERKGKEGDEKRCLTQ